MNKPLTRQSLAKLATITLQCLDEQATIEGNASAISPEEDAKTYKWIHKQLRDGNVWAWCCVVVTATYDDLTATATLGGCSYEVEADFRKDGYYDDMVRNVLDDLWRQIGAKALASDVRQAITTTFRGPTNTRYSRIIARCEAKRITVEYEDTLDVAANHAAAALQLFKKLGWHEKNDLVMGGTGDGYVFVQIAKRVDVR